MRALPALLLLVACGATPARAPDPAMAAAGATATVRSGTGPRCEATGGAVHLGGGFFVTAAHVVDGSTQRMRGGCPAGLPAITLGQQGPARLLKAGRERVDPVIGQRYLGAEDLAIILPARPSTMPAATLCATPPTPGDAALLVTPGGAIRTRILRLVVEPDPAFGAYLEIAERLNPGSSGGALFAANGCLAGIVSHRDEDGGPPRTRLVPAATIARFVGP